MSDDPRIVEAIKKYLHAEQQLLAVVADACPGDHRPIRHRDGLAAWCPACHRTRLGTPIYSDAS